MHFMDYWPSYLTVKGETGWILQVFIVVFLTLLISFIGRQLLNRLHHGLKKTPNPWDDSLVDAMRRPLTVMIWVIGIAFAARIVYHETHTALFEAAAPIRDVSIIFCVTWFLIRFINRAEKNFIHYREIEGEAFDRTTIDALAKLVRVSVLITATLVTLQTLGFSISGVLAFGGIGGVAIGFASKDLLANFFGGLMIYMDRPFAVGDWIRSPDRNIEGTVEDIGWRLTRIRTFDKRPLYLPNSTFTSIAVENPSRMTHRRIFETVGVRYDDAAKVRTIIQDVKKMLMDHPEIDETQTLIVNFDKFAPSSLDFFVYTFTHTTNWIRFHEVKEDVLLKIMDIIVAHGAEVAFPTSTIHIPEALRLETERVEK